MTTSSILPSAKNIRLGVIGVGGMGKGHARNIQDGNIPGARLDAVCDSLPANLEPWQGVEKFTDAQALIQSGLVDAVMIVTPHFSHAPLSIAALEAGLHVLVEKPLTVKKADAEQIVAAHQKTDRVFAIMFNQRTDPLYQKLREWIETGVLGRIQRIQWTITDWFRPQSYYESGSWRGTWAGEGGGILMNQAPHQLDLWQWLFGLPVRVRAFGGTGRYHNIEVEDDVTAFLEYADGTTGVLTTTTGEAPGVNRLEVAADNGLVILEGRTLRFLKNVISTSEYNRTSPDKFGKPPVKEETITFDNVGPQHTGILTNFIEAITEGKPLIARGEEGLRSLELANALTISLIEGKAVELPIDAAEFTALLQALIEKHKK
jgi:predicted dehydrogenase